MSSSYNTLQIGVPRSGSPAFVNQGQIDWVAFGNTIWQASSAMLQRFASSGVQPVTLGATLAVANEFRLSQKGQQRVEDALARLQLEYGFEKILYFGFGHRSFVRILAETQLGVNSIALLGCLSQSHGIELTASVMSELWQELHFPDQYKPSHNQFLLLAESCSGTLASSTFDDTVNLMLGEEFQHRNEPDSDDSDGRSLDSQSAHRAYIRASSAPQIAKAILVLFKLSKNSVEQVTIAGGPECAFVAAFAQWALGLRIRVTDKNDELIFASVINESEAQAIFNYREDSTQPSMELADEVYYLDTPASLFVHTAGPGMELIIRAPWSQCLRRSFGSSFDRLMEPFHPLSSYFGSGARIYQALALGEPYNGEFKHCLPRGMVDPFVETSYGHGFVHTAVNTFPELAVPHFQERMERAVDVSLTDAIKSATLASSSLKQLCQCTACQGQTSSDQGLFCLRIMANTIFHLVVQLGCTTWDPGLRPAVAGILSYYNSMSTEVIREFTSMEAELITFGGTLNWSGEPGTNPIDAVGLIFDGQGRPFQSSSNPRRSAYSRNGICCFMEALRGPSSKAKILRRVWVIPGHIQHGDRRYNIICDGESWVSDKPPIAELQPWDSTQPPPPLDTRGEIELKAMILERGRGETLLFYYKASVGDLTVMLQPGRFTLKVLSRTGLLTCSRNPTKCPQQLPGRCQAVRRGWRPEIPPYRPPPGKLPPIPGRPVVPSPTDPTPLYLLWSIESDVARLLALELYRRQNLVYSERRVDGPEDIHCFLREDECLGCSVASIRVLGMDSTYNIL